MLNKKLYDKNYPLKKYEIREKRFLGETYLHLLSEKGNFIIQCRFQSYAFLSYWSYFPIFARHLRLLSQCNKYLREQSFASSAPIRQTSTFIVGRSEANSTVKVDYLPSTIQQACKEDYAFLSRYMQRAPSIVEEPFLC